MKYFILLLNILFFCNETRSQNENGFRYKYILSNNIEGIVSRQLTLRDGSTIFIIKSKSWGTQAEEENVYGIIRINKAGTVLWSKKIKNEIYDCGIKEAILLEDESVLITGTFVHKRLATDYSEKLFLLKMGRDGQEIWGKFYQLNKLINNTNEINYPVLKEANNGSIYTCFVLQKEDILNGRRQNFPVIAKFTNTGDIIWNRYFFNVNNRWTNCFARTPVEIGNNIVGNFDMQDNESAGINGESYSLALKLNGSTGSNLQTQKYKFIGLSWEKGGILNDGNTVFNGSVIKNIIDFNSRMQLNSQTFLADDLQAISFDTDSNLNLVLAKEIHYKDLKQKNLSFDNYYYSKQFYFNSKGETLIGFKNFNRFDYVSSITDTLNYYFAKLSLDYSSVWQKKFFIYSPNNVNQEASSIIETNDCNTQIALTHITKNNPNNIQRSFEVIRFNPSIKYNNPCFGEDTSFIEVKDANIQQSPFFWDQEFTNILLPFNATLLLEDIPVIQTELCRIESDCSNFSLTGPDSTCAGENINLQLHKQSNCLLPVGWQLLPVAVADTFLLNDTTLSIRFKQPWQGTIYSYAGDCNTIIDSLFITVLPKPVPVDLGKDTLLCNNNPVLLKAGAAYKTYLWNTGSRDSLLTVSTAGKYWISVTDYCGTVSTDTIEVKEGIYSFIIKKDTTICKGDTVLLQATTGYINYQWTPPDYLSGSVSPSVLSYPESNTRYTVSAQTITGCTLEASVFVKVILCPETCFVPNSFTPNGDGNNDLFEPIIEGSLSAYQFSIFNRYGQQVFSSTEPGKGWDGTFRSIQQIPGTYTWQLSYRFKNRKPQFKKGTVLLIR